MTTATAPSEPEATAPAAEADELVWQGGLTAVDLAEVRVGLLLRLSVAQSNARAEKEKGRRQKLAGRVRTLQALLDKLRPADGDVAKLPRVEG